MLLITGSSIFLVGSESIVMLFIRWNIMTFSDIVVALTYAMPGFLSIFNTMINLLLRHEFRKQFLILFHLRSPSRVPQQSVWVHPSKTGISPTRFTEKTIAF
ncbi:hypothetical protein OESDEN_23283 [Oesophagostomum dentatum]|uniref:Uncharacterized protein n=1 Tax=Oesophagostomum dentatum TaxID=61180 RepID=A0A0B1S0V9_OESDE|nr:hypothetical protein OESDEN_23283 [Oesophagostomum dentatum]